MKTMTIILAVMSSILIVGFTLLCVLYGPPTYILRTLFYQDSGVYDYRIFPKRELHASQQQFNFEESAQSNQVSSIFHTILNIESWDNYLRDNGTQAFLVIQNDTILYEQYFNGLNRESLVTSFSIAKSITSALIGIAIQQGHIENVNDPITKYLPELLEKGEEFSKITIRHILMMTSGMDFRKTGFFDGDEVKAYYHPNLRKNAIAESSIKQNPEEVFLYNHYHPQLLGMILERTTGQHITDYVQKHIWDPLGMEYGGSWSLDSKRSGFEKMEAGLNARAIDFAKIGRLFLDEKTWEKQEVVPTEWIIESTSPDIQSMEMIQYPRWFSTGPAPIYYKYMWWGYVRENGNYDYYAEGDKGQYLYICPEKNLIIIRHGETYGNGGWNELFFQFCTQFS